MFVYTYQEIERVLLDLHQLAKPDDALSQKRIHVVREIFFAMIWDNSQMIDKDALDTNVVKMIDYYLAQPPLEA